LNYKNEWEARLDRLKNPPGYKPNEKASIILVYAVWVLFAFVFLLWVVSRFYPPLRDLFVPDDNVAPSRKRKVQKGDAPSFTSKLFNQGIFKYLKDLSSGKRFQEHVGLGANDASSSTTARESGTTTKRR
jgi:hypothetical protein